MSFNIAYSCDDKYFHHVYVAITLLRKNISIPLHVNFIHENIADYKLEQLKALTNEHLKISTYVIDKTKFAEFINEINYQNASDNTQKCNQYISHATFMKFLVADTLPKSLERVLYLDADTIVYDLDVYETLNIDDYAAAVCEDVAHRSYSAHIKSLNVNQFFNTGLVYMNLCEMRSNFNTSHALDVLKSLRNRRVFQDQDIFNKLISNNSLFMPISNNLLFSYNIPVKRSIRKHASVIHYVGIGKRYPLKWYVELLKSPYAKLLPRMLIDRLKIVILTYMNCLSRFYKYQIKQKLYIRR